MRRDRDDRTDGRDFEQRSARRDANGRYGRNDDRSYGSSRDRSWRENERVTMEGRITSLDRQRDGYRVYLNGSRHSFWVPDARLRHLGRDIRVGLAIRLGGIFRAGIVAVDVLGWPGYDDRYYDRDGYDDRYADDVVRGYVTDVSYRRGVLVLREDRSGRTIEVDLHDTRRSRLDVNDLRRGDYVTLSGTWRGGRYFEAYEIESIGTRRGY